MDYINRLKLESDNNSDIVYRKMNLKKTEITLIYSESLSSSDSISDFIIRSLNKIKISKDPLQSIKNNITNFKVNVGNTYEEMVENINNGFTIIIVDNQKEFLALETKANLNRGINTPTTEQSMRGSKDAFIENYQTNIGLIKRRIKSNDLWIKNLYLGKYTNTKIGILYIKSIAKKELVNKVIEELNKIDISGIVSGGTIKNLISKSNKHIMPTILTTERPDVASNALLEGKIIVIIDNNPYVLIIPALLNDFFKTAEDNSENSLNTTFTRIIKYICFFISLTAPAIYIALINYNQEILPTDLLISFATQRSGVPFPAFFEAFIMIISFEILRETDLRVPSFTGSALSIVGALILGEAAVNAGIVSPIMIIIIAITALSSLPFTEFEMINSLRWYRLLFMVGAALMGIVGVVICFIFLVIRLASLDSFGKPYLMPYVPTDFNGLKNSIIKFPINKLTNRSSYLSNNQTEFKEEEK